MVTGWELLQCDGEGAMVVLTHKEYPACGTVEMSGLQRLEEAGTDSICYYMEDLAKLVLSSHSATISRS